MQPNLPQDAKFRPEAGDAILRRYLALSDQATAPNHTGVADLTHLIWPESAFPFVLSREPRALAAIARALQGKTLITGAARAQEDQRPLQNLQRHRGGARRPHRGVLRQNASRALWRISAVERPAPPARRSASRSRNLGCRRGAAPFDRARPAAGGAVDLLRGDFFWRGGRGRRGPAAVAAERDQRRLVRHHQRPLPAFRAGAATGRGRRACLWCARPTPGYRRSWIPTAAFCNNCRSGSKA